MKINMPVTDTEVHFSENETLVSKTDLKGIITYVNKEFIKISGFTQDELVGKNHNLVRHPDMPPEAFQDLWDTLKQGKPWIQMVKNRCKNGDYYWVKANVTPVMQNGQIVEYMSVRAKPTREEIAEAETAFKQIKNGKLSLEYGNPVKPGIAKVFNKFGEIKLSTQNLITGILFACLVGLIGWQLSALRGNVEFTYKELEGEEYIRPVIYLLEYIPQHRGNTNVYLNGNDGLKPQIMSLREKIDVAFEDVHKMDALYGEDLKTTATLEALNREWETLKSQAFNLSAAESFSRHTQLIANVQNLVVMVGDNSNLILDPELNSFYAMDLVINKLPTLTESLGQSRGFGAGLISNGDPSTAQLKKLNAFFIELGIFYRGAQSSYNSGAAASKQFEEALETSIKESIASIEAFTKAIDTLSDGQNSLSSEQFFAAGTDAIDNTFKLYHDASDLLQVLLTERHAHLNTQFLIIATLTSVAVLLVALIAFFSSRNVKSTIDECIRVFQEIGNGNFKSAAFMKGNNELTSLTRSLNSVRIKQGFDIEDSRARGAETQRIKEALDVCTTNVMVADDSHNIIYMNNAIHHMFEVAEADLKKDLPDFNAARVFNANMDIFHKKPEHQRSVIESLKEPHKTTIKVGGRTFNLTATPVFDDDKQRMGTVIEWLDRTEALVQEQRERRVNNENQRIKVALDNVSANVMVADNERNIIYVNKAVVDTLTNAEQAIKRDVPSFNASTLVGTNIDQFHKNPEHQKGMLERLTDEYKTTLLIGGRNMDLLVNPVRNEEGERLGTVVEWQDRTEEVKIEKEIDNLVGSAAAGDLTQRIPMDGKVGFFAKLSGGLNQLVEAANSILTDVGHTFSAMAEGDLTQSISNSYQGDFERIKQDANRTIEKLTDAISKIRESANTINTASNEIAQGNADLSQRTEEQASSLEETASSMEEMTSTVKHSADSAKEANNLSTDARRRAQEGGDVVKQAVDAMAEILKSSNKINDIIGVIDEIAFQTNLLALNAAVEAARAGEQGRGFAVVAGEVRNLSQRSAAAAKEIKDLIKDSVAKVEAGSVLVNDSGTTLTSIVQAVEKVAGMISEISNASTEQTSGIEQINQAISQMDEMTQQNAALVEEASAASEAMSEQAGNMNRLVGFFRLGNINETYRAPSVVPAAPTKPEPIVGYQPKPASGGSSAGSKSSFADDDEWEDF